MKPKLRKMRDYHPRRSSKELKVHKQQLVDLEHRLSADLGELLIFLKEGSLQKLKDSSLQTKSDLLKLGPDMQKIALDLGAPYPKMVHAFLDSIDKILIAQSNGTPSPFYLWIDEAKIQNCHYATQRLERALVIQREKRP